MKIATVLLCFLFFIGIKLFAQPAMPAEGYRWILNENLSDEFEGTELSTVKWQNTDTRWIGREPGLFTAEAVTVGDGKMRITTDIFTEPRVVNNITWTHQGGHVRSKDKVKPGSYIECSMKANKTFMSSTFWLINYSNESSDCQRRTTELDIQECIGYPATHAKTTQMGSNTHSRGVPETCTQIASGSKGNHAETNGKVYDKYMTYAAWWKGPREILFYLDGEYKYTVNPVADFDIDMYIKMVCETYNWSPVPADGGMTGSWEDRTTYYDWVRTYSYVPADEPSDATTEVFTEEVDFTIKPSELLSDELIFRINYKANSNKKLVLALKDSEGNVAVSAEKTVYPGFANMKLTLEDLKLNGNYLAVVSIYDPSDNSLISSNEYNLKVSERDLAIGDDTVLKEVKLVPNPAKNKVTINGLNEPANFEIYAIGGNMVMQGNTSDANSQIDISSFSDGTYVVKISTNSATKSIKLIKG